MEEILLEFLTKRQMITPEEYSRVLADLSYGQETVEEILLRRKLFSREELIRILENRFFVPFFSVQGINIPTDLAGKFSASFLESKVFIPVRIETNVLHVVFHNPDDIDLILKVESIAGCKLKVGVGFENEIIEAIRKNHKYFKTDIIEKKKVKTSALNELKAVKLNPTETIFADNADVPDLFKQVVSAAVEKNASDIHFETKRDGEMNIRFRIDGLLARFFIIPPALMPTLISHVKIIADMDIAEKRLPQDGRINFPLSNSRVDLRISTLPSKNSEKIVIRILRKEPKLMNISGLGMPKEMLEQIESMLKSSRGLILVAGPTGSGKTTSLYAMLNYLPDDIINITTIEDPIEYELPGITQVQILEKAGLTFPRCLRAILRQDPDSIMVGEIRDLETVEIACRAALTGHLVLSTVHTNDAVKTISRLQDMDVPAYLIASTLTGVIAQRLVRRICENCKVSYQASQLEKQLVGNSSVELLYSGKGCPSCNYTGYNGRLGIYELLVIDEEIQYMILKKLPVNKIKEYAKSKGMVTMKEHSIDCVLRGLTNVDELTRVILTDEDKELYCPQCLQEIRREFTICPYCRYRLKELCDNCKLPLQPNWNTCPQCGADIIHQVKTKICPKCFATIEIDSASCPYCSGY